jgi:hypothetical protein
VGRRNQSGDGPNNRPIVSQLFVSVRCPELCVSLSLSSACCDGTDYNRAGGGGGESKGSSLHAPPPITSLLPARPGRLGAAIHEETLDRAFPTVCYCTRIRGKYFSNHFKEFFVILFFILFYLFIPGRRACAAILAESPERETGEFRRENLSFLGIGVADVHKFGGWGGMRCRVQRAAGIYIISRPRLLGASPARIL